MSGESVAKYRLCKGKCKINNLIREKSCTSILFYLLWLSGSPSLFARLALFSFLWLLIQLSYLLGFFLLPCSTQSSAFRNCRLSPLFLWKGIKYTSNHLFCWVAILLSNTKPWLNWLSSIISSLLNDRYSQ